MSDLSKLKKQQYTNWLKRKRKSNGELYSENTVNSYASSLTTAPARLSGIELENTNVYEITSADYFHGIRRRIEKAENFDEINVKAGNRAFQYALEYYEDFLREQEKGTDMAAAEDSSNSVIADKTSALAVTTRLPSALLDKNIILYGPPGTGKTYNTVTYAVAIIENKPLHIILDEVKNSGYDVILKRYRSYKNKGQIDFTTFHQSYGYEEFIEGIKPKIQQGDETGQIRDEIAYEIKPGVFKQFCEKAQIPVIQDSNSYGIRKEPVIWKVSLGGSGQNQVKRDCFDNNRIRIGWDSYGERITDETDFREYGGATILSRFMSEMVIGDIVLILHDEKTIDAIGVVTGEYEWIDEMEDYKRSREVKWLAKDIRGDIYALNGNKVLTLGSVYRLNRITLADVLVMMKANNNVLGTAIKENANNYVFIIDEINRGNISKILGELITLIEPSKRIGQSEEITLRLPYSQEDFGVPGNVYLLATMNTADRSIARLDTALRRRFHFAEMMPQPEILETLSVGNEVIELSSMLAAMNRRIEVLYDREHMIGHAYFISLKSHSALNELSHIFRNTIIPLLQEYFYEDYDKIRLVLGDNNKPESEQFILAKKTNIVELFGNMNSFDFDDEVAYEINNVAFGQVEAYSKIYRHSSL
ncbi:AAA family ATPase [Paenibacillus monticola]|uniref:AAA domain-containing protein n=1 Tax=Paenibacillus monticola TaxID=2666075 RepID=A0A7X2H7L1_9BACL|nr:AAA family ATPase [Paenibacillus monticola]MRN54928.1 AAA domain-containing protein [Paenibacillus monticola]